MIEYSSKRSITVEELKEVLQRSTLGKRRRLDDDQRLQRNLDHADFLCTAWDADLLIGMARGLTDFGDVAYLADLCVDKHYQHQGIGKQLVQQVKGVIGDDVKIVLFAAPAAVNYYPKIGFTANRNGFSL